ncbi:MAG: LysR family transcriptional regulator [Pseudomonadota bacterium]
MPSGQNDGLDWNLIRTFVAVAGSGSLAGAARSLGLAHPTVARHVQQLEAQLGLMLFDRTKQGVVLNEAGVRLAEQATAMRREALAFERLTDSVREKPLPRIRITMAELLVEIVPQLLARAFAELRSEETQFELCISNDVVNLLERDADIALRHVRPSQQELVARQIGSLAMTGYATRDYLARFGPVTEETIERHQFIDDASVGRFVKGAASVGTVIPEDRVVVRSDSLQSQRSAMLAGLGIAVLPAPMAATLPDVVPVFARGEAAVMLDVWLVARREMRDNAQVRAVFDLLGDNFSAHCAEIVAASPPQGVGATV